MESLNRNGKAIANSVLRSVWGSAWIAAILAVWGPAASIAEAPVVRFDREPGQIKILVGEQPFARYVFEDDRIPRPYFCDIHAPDGIQVSRNHPPIEGVDRTDHPTFHPGLWLAFGDISGADYWRLKAGVEHKEFVEEPKGDPGVGTFSVKKVYQSDQGEICREDCRYRLEVIPAEELGGGASSAYLFFHDSEFYSDEKDFVFGDQEEMGLGVRVATPISGKEEGVITNSLGAKTEAETWGKTADWCDYSGPLKDRRVGMTLIPHPENFRKSWFHARDYGVLLANPFGEKAFTDAHEPSAIPVKKGERFPLRFGVFIYSTETGNEGLPAKGYEAYLKRIRG